MDVSKATIALYLVSAVAVTVAFLWLGQRPTAVELGGGAVALAGVALSNTARRPSQDEKRSAQGEAAAPEAGRART